MIHEIKEHDEGMRMNYRRDKIPYFSYRYGEKSRGIIRIGRWTEEHTYFDKEKRRNVREVKRRNVTPNKMQRVIKTFGRDAQNVEVHLFFADLPDAEAAKWMALFPDACVDEDVM